MNTTGRRVAAPTLISKRGAFVLTDAGGYSRLVKAASDEGPFAAVFDYGLMVNVTPHDAVGASFFASIETNPAEGPAVRYRRWFDSNSSLDVALGVPQTAANRVGSGS